MNCPHCGAEHPPEGGRFCDACGLSVIGIVPKKDADEEVEATPERCPACGAKARPPVCPACFTRLPGAAEE